MDDLKLTPVIHGWDEINLASLPFTKLSSRDRRDEIYVEWDAIGRDGKMHRFFRRVEGNPNLPHAFTEHVLVALTHLAGRSGVFQKRFETHYYEILQTMRLPDTGKYRDGLRESFEALRTIRISTNSIWNEEKDHYDASTTFGFIAHHADPRNTDLPEDSRQKKMVTIQWTDPFYSLLISSSKSIDIGVYYDLKTDLARRFYRHIDSHLHQFGVYREDLMVAAHAHLGISPSRKYVSQVLDLIERSLRDLYEKGVIEKVEVMEDPSMPSGHMLTIRGHGPRTMKIALGAADDWKRALAKQICIRGYERTPGKHDGMDDLMETLPHFTEREVIDIIEEYDRRIALPAKDPNKIHGPGWFRGTFRSILKKRGAPVRLTNQPELFDWPNVSIESAEDTALRVGEIQGLLSPEKFAHLHQQASQYTASMRNSRAREIVYNQQIVDLFQKETA